MWPMLSLVRRPGSNQLARALSLYASGAAHITASPPIGSGQSRRAPAAVFARLGYVLACVSCLLLACIGTTSATMTTHAARPGEEVPNVDHSNMGPTGVMEVPSRLLMGPGPSNAHPRVLAAQTLPLLGHMHPAFFKIMDDVSKGLRYLFQTQSKYTLLISGTGHAGMEAAVANLLEPGEKIVVGVNGIWGERVVDLAGRYGGEVIQLKTAPGGTLSYEEIKASLEEHKPAMLFLVQGESSTGAHQSMAGLGELCHQHGTLLVVDTVASLGGVPMFADKWGVDCIYSGSQKVLSAPPGAAPLFFSERAVAKLKGRKTKVASYNLDLNLIGEYWGWFGEKRTYHHTAMISTVYALREALAIVAEEGLEPMWQRHLDAHQQLWKGLSALGLQPFVENDADRLITVNTIKVPKGIDWAAVCKFAMDKYSVEIAGGLGPSMGQVWRIGLMGYNAKPQAVELVLTSFRDALAAQNWAPAVRAQLKDEL